MSNLFEEYNAILSKNGKHRFALWRIWDKELPKIAFIGLNPSTANHLKDDPTIKRVRRFAKDWGYGGFYMLNLFTKVTPNPDDLLIEPNIKMTSNYYLSHYASLSNEICFCWGAFKQAQKRAKEIIEMFPDATTLGYNNNGSPKHPLFVRADTKRTIFIDINKKT